MNAQDKERLAVRLTAPLIYLWSVSGKKHIKSAVVLFGFKKTGFRYFRN